MTHPLQRWMKAAGFGTSWSKLARRVLEDAPGLFPETPEPQRYRRLSLELSRLAKGQTSWWSNHARARQSLATLLGVSEEHVVKGEPAGELIVFSEFPALRPLDLTTEKPLAGLGQLRKPDGSLSGGFNLFSNAHLPSDRPLWIQVPPGAGKTLAIRLRQVRRPGPASLFDGLLSATMTVPRLTDIESSGVSAQQSVLFEVESSEPRTDLEVVRRLRGHSRLIVVAPFARPGATEEYEAAVRASRKSYDSKRQTWKDRTWGPAAGWRRAFIDWVADRLGVERKGFQAEEFCAWLERLDPDTRLVRTPGEVLTLCDLAHEMGTRRLTRQFTDGWKDVARTVTARILQREVIDDSSRAFWLRAAGTEAIRTLTRAAFEDVASSWPPSASQEVWAQRLPGNYAAPVKEEVLDEKLLAIGQARGERLRQRRVQEAKAAIRPLSGLMAIEYLASTRLLRVQPDGRPGPYPRWMADALARELLDDAFMLDPETWGRWAADPSRQSLVDPTLDLLPLPRLVALAERVVRAFDVSRLGLVGAVESLFAAFARRFETSPAPVVQQELLHGLVRCLLAGLTLRFREGAPCPVTRPGIGDDSNAWLADCWSWSFSVAAPSWSLPGELDWLFPGWTHPSLTAPGLNRYLSVAREQDGMSDNGLARLLARAVSVLDRCCGTTPPTQVPMLLCPALLVWAARRGIVLEAKLVERLLEGTHFQKQLQRQLGGEGPETQTAVADLLFRGLARRADGVVNLFLESNHGPSLLEPTLKEWLLGRLEDSAIERALEESGPGRLEFLSPVPPRILLLVARHFIERKPEPVQPFRVGNVEAAHVPALELLLGYGPSSVELAAALWRLAPERTLQLSIQALARDATDRSVSAVQDLFHTSPHDLREALLGALGGVKAPGTGDPWVPVWLAREVHRGGVLSERAYALWLKWRPVPATPTSL